MIPRCVNLSSYQNALAVASLQIQETGFCEIPNFLHPEFVTALIAEAESLKPQGFRSFESHNIYLEEDDGDDENGNEHENENENPAKNGADGITISEIGKRSKSGVCIDAGEKCSKNDASPEDDNSSGRSHGITGRTAVTEIPRRQRETSSIRGETFSSSKILVNKEQIKNSGTSKEETFHGSARSHLLELYQWDGLSKLLQKAFSLPSTLHVSGDPIAGLYYNFFEKGDKLGWHFDRSEFSVNLILRENATGGKFMYWPDSRKAVDAMQTQKWKVLEEKLRKMQEGALERGQAEIQCPKEGGGEHSSADCDVNAEARLVIPDLKPGTLYLFAGSRSLHCVSEVRDEITRLNAIFTYNREPNVCLNEYARKKFFGK